MSTAFDLEKRAVDALLASSMFQRAPNLRKVIAFLWEQHAHGTTDQIKEYTIATEVLGRPPSFDQKRDAIVRVEMHRLRKRLREYYEGPGANSEVVMYIPEGNYVPVFEARKGDVAITPAVVAPAEADVCAEDPEPEAWMEQLVPVQAPVRTARPARPARRQGSWWTAAISIGLGVILLGVLVGAFLSRKSAGQVAAAVSSPARAPGTERGTSTEGGIRILAGREKGGPVMDHLGQLWENDGYFVGGVARSGQRSKIAGAPEQFLFDNRREGDFQYNIPLDPGAYELRLYFAETVFGDGNVAGMGESSRLFHIDANTHPLLQLFDVISDAEAANLASVKVFKNIRPAGDGRLHLNFRSYSNGRPFLNAIEIRPAPDGRMLPIRMVAQDQAIRDTQGHLWVPDHWVTGGVRIRRPAPPSGAADGDLYLGERFGHFTYRIPVSAGTFQVTAYMAEAWFGPNAEGGGGPASRLFNLYCNHRPLLENFDLYAAAGGTGKAYRRVFTGLKANAQGKLVLQFQPETNYAALNALSVEDVSPVQ